MRQKQGERGRVRARDEHLYCISSRVLRSHVISISKKSSGQFRQQVVGKVRIVNPTLEKKKVINHTCTIVMPEVNV